jgi:hypothetical protein
LVLFFKVIASIINTIKTMVKNMVIIKGKDGGIGKTAAVIENLLF